MARRLPPARVDVAGPESARAVATPAQSSNASMPPSVANRQVRNRPSPGVSPPARRRASIRPVSTSTTAPTARSPTANPMVQRGRFHWRMMADTSASIPMQPSAKSPQTCVDAGPVATAYSLVPLRTPSCARSSAATICCALA